MRFSFPHVVLLVSMVLAVPESAGAVTVRDIIELTKAGLPDDVLTALIEADRTIFTLDAEQILTLKRAGVREAVLLKMIRSRREFDTQPKDPPAAPDPEPPQVVIIGAERVETKVPADRDVDVPADRDAVVVPQYFYVPMFWGWPAPNHVDSPAHQVTTQPFLALEHRGFGRFINDGWIGRR